MCCNILDHYIVCIIKDTKIEGLKFLKNSIFLGGGFQRINIKIFNKMLYKQFLMGVKKHPYLF